MSGAPRNSSKASIIRCMNSRTTRGSTSEEVVARKRRFAWFRLKTSVGGFEFGR